MMLCRIASTKRLCQSFFVVSMSAEGLIAIWAALVADRKSQKLEFLSNATGGLQRRR